MLGSPARFASCALVAVGLLAFGCQRPASPSRRAAAVPAASEPATTVPAPGGVAVTVDVKSWKDVEHMVAERRGKVVVVDLWSTWCAPCMREFPNLVALQRKHPDTVACISVDIDYIGVADEPPESFRDKVLAFLKKHNATFANVICSDPDEEVLKAVGASSVPVVLVYDRSGRLRKTFASDDEQYGEEGFSYRRHIAPLVEQLLRE